jgi:hypothetical protein
MFSDWSIRYWPANAGPCRWQHDRIPGIAGTFKVSPALQQLVDDGRRVVIPGARIQRRHRLQPATDYLDWLVVFGTRPMPPAPPRRTGRRVAASAGASPPNCRPPRSRCQTGASRAAGIADEQRRLDLYATPSAGGSPTSSPKERPDQVATASPTSARRKHRRHIPRR